MTTLLKTKNLTKDYGNAKGAFDVSIEIKPGEIVGFIGPNGAGKTTTMLMLTGFIKQSSGSFEMFGDKNVNHLNIYKHMDRLGILMSDVAYDKNTKVKDIFKRVAQLTGSTSTKSPNSIQSWKEFADYLSLDVDSKFGKLSLGNKKKVGIIASIMHSPELLIMDEPTSGLDPLIQQKFLVKMKEVKERGGSVLLSSHVLSEVQNVCDRIIMIKGGKIILQDTTQNILNQALSVFRIPIEHKSAIVDISKKDFTDRYSEKMNAIEVFTNDKEKIIRYLTDKKIFNYYIEKPDLEDTFLTKY